MLKIENTRVEGFEPAIRGMRNPMNSWDKSDSLFSRSTGFFENIKGEVIDEWEKDFVPDFILGLNDEKLMRQLANAGKDHAKYRRMIIVWADILAPLYWWKEFDTYKVGTVANSCSTMHKIQAKEFTIDDFSHEHLISPYEILFDRSSEMLKEPSLAVVLVNEEKAYYTPYDFLSMTCDALNHFRKLYLETKDKRYWWQMIQLLPSSYNQRRTVMLNYEVLANIYPARKDHKLDEWHTFCSWIESLPESWIITGKTDEEET